MTYTMTRRAAIAAAVAACTPVGKAGSRAALGSMRERRAVHAAVRSGSEILIIGGFANEGTGLQLVERFDSDLGLFESFAQLNAPRIQPLVETLNDGRLLVLGGEWRSGPSTAEILEGAVFVPLGDMNDARNASASARLPDGRVLICGGHDAAAAMIRTAEVFDPATRRFERIGDMQSPRAGHTATALPDGRILIAGGGTESAAIRDVEIFDPYTEQFIEAQPLRQARFKHGAAVLPGGDILVVGGSRAGGGAERGRLRDTERFDAARFAFVAGPPLVDPRYKLLPSTLSLDDGSIVVASGGLRPEVLRSGASAFEALPVNFGARRDYMAAVSLAAGKVLVTGGYDESIEPTDAAWIVSL